LLTEAAAKLAPGESVLLALGWHNGNRSILANPRLSGLMVGQTLATRPEEIYRALIEATAFGFRTIVERVSGVGVTVDEIVACGGIARKNELLLSIYSDVVGRPLQLARSGETCALGAAIFGAVAAGRAGGGHDSIRDAQRAMAHLEDRVFRPNPAHREPYDALYALYRQVHDAFGGVTTSANLGGVMKELFALRKRACVRR
jgi:L-ribulokinase